MVTNMSNIVTCGGNLIRIQKLVSYFLPSPYNYLSFPSVVVHYLFSGNNIYRIYCLHVYFTHHNANNRGIILYMYAPSVGLMEIAKRKKALETMGEKHPLHPLAVECLHDNPARRPPAEELNKRLADLCIHEYPKTFADILDVTAEVLLTSNLLVLLAVTLVCCHSELLEKLDFILLQRIIFAM